MCSSVTDVCSSVTDVCSSVTDVCSSVAIYYFLYCFSYVTRLILDHLKIYRRGPMALSDDFYLGKIDSMIKNNLRETVSVCDVSQ